MTTAATPADEDRVVRADLDLDPRIVELVERDLLPRRGLTPDTFWAGVAGILDELTPRNDALLARRAELQAAIDDWHRTHDTIEPAEYRRFLEELGYLEPPGEAFEITTSGVAAEIATVAGPQLVVPVTNARYAINAVNARWGSLYDAVYGTDVLGSPPPAGPYDEARGAAVIAEVRRMLDVLLPLAGAAHADVTRYLVAGDRLVVELAGGGSTVAADTVDLVGWDGASASPSAVVCRHHGLGVELVIEPASPVGRTDVAGVSDVRLESAVTTIMDCEDSVATVDGSDKAVAYRNWFGLLDGSLEAPVDKDGRTFVRRLRPERTVTGPGGTLVAVPTRAVLLVRTVGLLMRTPAVRRAGVDAYEGIVDAVLTVLGAAAATGDEPVYVVKPKLHGPDEVRFTSDLFAAVEDLVGLPRDTVKIGIMDEERRTTLNLAECVRAARSRVVFVNTGFLDRTGDEIHTSMHAGPMVRKADMRTQRWIGAYERNNVEVGLRCGLPGRAQIGKGMWAAPDLMRDMLATKVAHPEAGASCAWVPSPTAATLHAIHYHHVDVAAVQVELARAMVVDGRRVEVDDLLAVPLATDARWSPAEIQAELDNNAQGILGYVVRWVDQGVGCSKVPDIHDVGLMEDRATCRISSQHLANWLLHGVVTPDQVMDTMRRMARVVDEQNVGDAAYRPMAPGYDGDAFRAACELVLAGTEHPSGYTEPVLHAHRLAVKHAEG